MAGPITHKPEVAQSLFGQIIAERARRVEAKPETIRKFYDDPLGFVRWNWRWGLPGPLERFEGARVHARLQGILIREGTA